MSFIKKTDIRFRFTLILTTISLAFLILFSMVVYSQAKKKAYDFAKENLITWIGHEWDHLDLTPSHTKIRALAPHFKDVYLRVWKAKVLLYDSFPREFPEEFPPAGELSKNKLFHESSKFRDGHQYELQGFYDLTSTNAYLLFLRNIFIVSCFLAAIILVPISLFATRLFLKPFRDLAISTSEVTVERLAFRFEQSETKDEYGMLTRNFNALLNRLEKSFLQMKRFALNASHELRTPLAVIISQGEMALRKERSIEECRLAIDKMLSPAKRLREIVNRLLFLAELDRLEQEKRIVKIDVETALKLVIETIQDAYKSEIKRTQVINANGSAEFIGNREIFDIVAGNLIENAFKFSKQWIRITFKKNGQGLCLVIEDDGPGIAPNNIGFILEPLYRTQISEGGTSGKMGTGLGLSIVKACLDSVTGTIQFSKSDLGGLSVTVVFPQSKLT